MMFDSSTLNSLLKFFYDNSLHHSKEITLFSQLMTAYTSFISTCTIPNSFNKSPLVSKFSHPSISPSHSISLSIKTVFLPILNQPLKPSYPPLTQGLLPTVVLEGPPIHPQHILFFFHILRGYVCDF